MGHPGVYEQSSFQNPGAVKKKLFPSVLFLFLPPFSFLHSKSHGSLLRDSKWVPPSTALRAKKTPYPLFSSSTSSSRKVLKASCLICQLLYVPILVLCSFFQKPVYPVLWAQMDGSLGCLAVLFIGAFCLFVYKLGVLVYQKGQRKGTTHGTVMRMSPCPFFYSLIVSIYLLCSLPLFLLPFVSSWLLMTSACWPSVPLV